MDKTRRLLNTRMNLPQMLQYRETHRDGSKHLQQNCHFSFDLIKRLGVQHEGCVNCLQWSTDGRLLASGSDDTKVIIWEPMKHRRPHILSTIHVGNIFSVKFLGVNNSMIASSAGDGKVSVQELRGSQILHCICHKSRVKRLATCPVVSTMFWSASEDSKVIQYDLRQPHICTSQTANLFLSFGSHCEIKCIAVNPTKPHYIAVGCNDAYVRIYDRRKIKTCILSEINHSISEYTYPSSSTLTDPNVVQYYAPGHIAIDNADISSIRHAVTYIEFNSAGSEMLVNMGGEHLYLFNIENVKPVSEIRFPSLSRSRTKYKTFQCKCKPEECSSYNQQIYSGELSPSKDLCACFYMRRGYHSYKRRMGDLYAAARDFLHVIQKWPHERKAYAQQILDSIQQSKGRKKDIDTREAIEPEQAEVERRLDSMDSDLRFLGHCNTTTDIMEANFLGNDFICAGSDTGVIFIWEKKTQSIINALVGDMSIVNCLQPHPSTCLIASSGIDVSVKLWSPMPESNSENSRVIKDCNSLVKANQTRILMDPFGTVLLGMGFNMPETLVSSEREILAAISEMPNCEAS
ncbi:hypothetical protein HUJ04_011358 [Dendroctonus ponderosae]|nr:hypothetical protein HUJ04_011358 [Dendroctonus ponderosae]